MPCHRQSSGTKGPEVLIAKVTERVARSDLRTCFRSNSSGSVFPEAFVRADLRSRLTDLFIEKISRIRSPERSPRSISHKKFLPCLQNHLPSVRIQVQDRASEIFIKSSDRISKSTLNCPHTDDRKRSLRSNTERKTGNAQSKGEARI